MYGWIVVPVCYDRKPAGWWLEGQWGQKCRQGGVPGFDIGFHLESIRLSEFHFNTFGPIIDFFFLDQNLALSQVLLPEAQSFEQWHWQQARPGGNSQEPASEIYFRNQPQPSPSLFKFSDITCKSLHEERRLARQADEMVAKERSRCDNFDESIPPRLSGKVTWL